MKITSKRFLIDKYFISVLPTVFIMVNEPYFKTENIAIELHFLIFHLRIFWEKGAN